MFTQMKIDPAQAAQRAAEQQISLKANTGVSDLLGYGLGVVSRRLQRDPKRYTDYGPYWWSLKRLLHDAGYQAGEGTDVMLAAEYRGETPLLTLVMADLFREMSLETTAVGNRQFFLSDDPAGNPYLLFDPDMESIT